VDYNLNYSLLIIVKAINR